LKTGIRIFYFWKQSRLEQMCWGVEEPMRLWLTGPGPRRAVDVAPSASVEDLVAATSTALALRPGRIDLVFSDVPMPIGASLASLGVCPDAEFRAVERPAAHEPPPRFDWRLIAADPDLWWVCAWIACALGGLVLSIYGYLSIDFGCREPACRAGASLQCCDRLGCTPRPDLANLTCAAWRAADRPCDRYLCLHSGTVEQPSESVVGGPPNGRDVLCITGLAWAGLCLLSGCAALASIANRPRGRL
jgi:hypothetical protein